MTWLSKIERRVLWRRMGFALIASLLVYIALMTLDRPFFRSFGIGQELLHSWEDQDVYRILRVVGSMWAWALVSLLFAAHDARSPRSGGSGLGRAALIASAAALAGIGAEAAKMCVQRLRPTDTDGFYAYAPLLETSWGSINGFPSSHAAVAFGGACMTAWLAPRLGPIVVALALGCCATRVLSGAHFLTDVYAGGLLGYSAARLLRPGGWWGAGVQRRILLP